MGWSSTLTYDVHKIMIENKTILSTHPARSPLLPNFFSRRSGPKTVAIKSWWVLARGFWMKVLDSLIVKFKYKELFCLKCFEM